MADKILEVFANTPAAILTLFPYVKENGKPSVGLAIKKEAMRDAPLNGAPAWVIGFDSDGGPNAAIALSKGLTENWEKAVKMAAEQEN